MINRPLRSMPDGQCHEASTTTAGAASRDYVTTVTCSSEASVHFRHATAGYRTNVPLELQRGRNNEIQG